MPRNADGSITRARYTALKLGELSSVDRPAQPSALAVCFKRADAPDFDRAEVELIAKYICEDDGAHSFTEVLSENQFREKIWPFTDALSQSIRSIIGDTALTGAERQAKVDTSVASFLAAVQAISPQVGKQLEGLINKKDGPMPKSAEELQAELTKAQGDLATMTERAEKAETDLTAANAAKATAEQERDAAKAEGGELATVKAELATAKAALIAATDETVKVDETTEVKKSEVGDAQFKVTKALVEKAELATLEKRAETEFSHVTGTPAEKARVLQAINKIADEPTRKAATAIVTSAEKMASGAFALLGGHGGLQPTEKQAAATTSFNAEVAKNVEAGMKEHEAMSKARRDHPALFAEMNGDAAASTAAQ